MYFSVNALPQCAPTQSNACRYVCHLGCSGGCGMRPRPSAYAAPVHLHTGARSSTESHFIASQFIILISIFGSIDTHEPNDYCPIELCPLSVLLLLLYKFSHCFCKQKGRCRQLCSMQHMLSAL